MTHRTLLTAATLASLVGFTPALAACSSATDDASADDASALSRRHPDAGAKDASPTTGSCPTSDAGAPTSGDASSGAPPGSSDAGGAGSSVPGYDTTTLVDDMKLASDAPVIAGVSMGTTDHAVITHGLPRGDANAAWSCAEDYGDIPAHCTAGSMWSQTNTWFVLYPADGNQDGSTFVEFRNDTACVLYDDGTWLEIAPPADEGWAGTFNDAHSYGQETQPDGHVSYRGDADWFVHGGAAAGVNIPSPEHAVAFHHRLEARLVMDASAYDPTRTKWMVQVGQDIYWPGYDTSLVIPAAMASRSRAVTPEWQAFTATTVKPDDDPDVVFSPPENMSLKTYLTEEDLQANPPPGIF